MEQFCSKPGGRSPSLRLLALFALLPFARAAQATTIDIMLVYDNTASTWIAANGDMNTFSQDAVNRINQAMQNSGIDATFRLVHSMQVDYNHTSLDSDLTQLQLGEGAFVTVDNARDTYGADLVAMLVDTDSLDAPVGISYLLTDWSGYAPYGLSVSAIHAVAVDHTLTRGVGHNLGAYHARTQASYPGPNPYLDNEYSAGWYFIGADAVAYRTIMAYGDGNRYTEAPFFSTPLQIYQGTPVGNANSANNAQLITLTKNTIAAYRAVPGSDLGDSNPPLPDLITTTVTTGTQGTQIQVRTTVSNQGNDVAGPNWLGYYLSTDATITLSDIYTGWGCSVEALAAGRTRMLCSGSIPLPEDITPGTYYVGAYIDNNEAVTESDETNNGSAASHTITIGTTELELEVVVVGRGHVTSDSIDIDCSSTCQQILASGTEITLTATPEDGVDFVGWGGDCVNEGITDTCTLSIDVDPLVVAAFGAIAPRGETTAWNVAEIYMATMGYAPDNEGLQYWVTNIDQMPQWTSETVAQSFFDQPLVQAAYPTTMTNREFIDALYRNIYGRSADAGGMDYWLQQLDNGQIARNQMIIAMINGGWSNASPDALSDMQRFGYRIDVAMEFAEYQADNGIVYSQLSEADQGYLRTIGRNILFGVTTDISTRDAAIASIPSLLATLTESSLN